MRRGRAQLEAATAYRALKYVYNVHQHNAIARYSFVEVFGVVKYILPSKGRSPVKASLPRLSRRGHIGCNPFKTYVIYLCFSETAFRSNMYTFVHCDINVQNVLYGKLDLFLSRKGFRFDINVIACVGG